MNMTRAFRLVAPGRYSPFEALGHRTECIRAAANVNRGAERSRFWAQASRSTISRA